MCPFCGNNHGDEDRCISNPNKVSLTSFPTELPPRICRFCHKLKSSCICDDGHVCSCRTCGQTRDFCICEGRHPARCDRCLRDPEGCKDSFCQKLSDYINAVSSVSLKEQKRSQEEAWLKELKTRVKRGEKTCAFCKLGPVGCLESGCEELWEIYLLSPQS